GKLESSRLAGERRQPVYAVALRDHMQLQSFLPRYGFELHQLFLGNLPGGIERTIHSPCLDPVVQVTIRGKGTLLQDMKTYRYRNSIAMRTWLSIRRKIVDLRPEAFFQGSQHDVLRGGAQGDVALPLLRIQLTHDAAGR